jgi:hypothetical protein
MGHVFISYAREDRAPVAALRSALEGHGLNVWLDERLMAGSHYDVEIEKALDEADSVIVAWSPASAASQWVKAEAGEGLARGVLVPVVIEPTRIPLEFRRIQSLDLTGWEGDAESPLVEELVAALSGREAPRPRQAEPPALNRLTNSNSAVSAEVLSASKYLASIRIRLQIGSRSFSIRHTSLGIYQLVRVDGRIVSRGPFSVLHHHHRFTLPAPDGEQEADLFLKGDPSSGLLSGVVLNLGGREVLRERVRWSDGFMGLIFLLFTLAMTGAFWIEVIDPLIGSTLLAMLGMLVVLTVLTALWFAVG